jgi:hypothetical protein
MSDRYERFGFWTNFRSWRPVAPGPALELIEMTMTCEQSSSTLFEEFKAFVEALADGTHPPDQSSDPEFRALVKGIISVFFEFWTHF